MIQTLPRLFPYHKQTFTIDGMKIKCVSRICRALCWTQVAWPQNGHCSEGTGYCSHNVQQSHDSIAVV